MLRCEKAAGAADPGLHFIEHEECSVAPAQLLRAWQILVAGHDDARLALDRLGRVSFAVFVPLYFAMAGYQLDVTRTFAFDVMLVVLIAACAIKLVAAAAGAGWPGSTAGNQ